MTLSLSPRGDLSAGGDEGERKGRAKQGKKGTRVTGHGEMMEEEKGRKEEKKGDKGKEERV